jgi:cytokinin trans-hydroxylase
VLPEVPHLLHPSCVVHAERPPTYADMAALPLLGCVIYETLRLYPAVPFMSRMLVGDKDVLLRIQSSPGTAATTMGAASAAPAAPARWAAAGGLVVKAGSGIFIPIGVLHRDPRYWGADAAEFRPDRFATASPRHAPIHCKQA